MGAQKVTMFAGRRSDSEPLPGPDPSAPIPGKSAALSRQEIYDRFIGTRAELDARIDGALEYILHLQVDGQDAEARRKVRSLCDALDQAIDNVTALSVLESGS
jgi:hypothetical protein